MYRPEVSLCQILKAFNTKGAERKSVLSPSRNTRDREASITPLLAAFVAGSFSFSPESNSVTSRAMAATLRIRVLES